MPLPRDTQRLWDRLRSEPQLAEFVLVGGTALTLRIDHRLSEDLDFMFAGGEQLPRPRLDQLVRRLATEGVHLQRNDDPAAVDEFEIAGMDLHRYQQDFLADGSTKVSFFVPDREAQCVLKPGTNDGPRVAELEEVFALKSLLTAKRSRTRDWYDLWVLMENHGFTMADLRTAFDVANVPTLRETAMRRLHAGTVPLHDPGYAALEKGPHPLPTIDQLRAYFRRAVEAAEVKAAAQELGPGRGR